MSASRIPNKHWKASTGRLLALGLCCLSIPACGENGPIEPPPVLYELPDFELRTQSEQSFDQADLKGRIWVADFIFTRCPSICPQMTLRMEHLAGRLRGREEVGFLSISVDPAHDTPSVLADYAARIPAREDRWVFATGEAEAIRTLCMDGFKLGFSEAEAGSPDGPITHSQRFVLIDHHGRIRGYYEGLENEAMMELEGHIAALLNEREADGSAASIEDEDQRARSTRPETPTTEG